MEAFDPAVLPRTARFDIDRLDAMLPEPVLHDVGDELTAIVATQVVRCAVVPHRLLHHFEHVFAGELAGRADGQALPGVLVDQGQHFERPSVVGPVMDEVPTPHLVTVCGPLHPPPSTRPGDASSGAEASPSVPPADA